MNFLMGVPVSYSLCKVRDDCNYEIVVIMNHLLIHVVIIFPGLTKQCSKHGNNFPISIP